MSTESQEVVGTEPDELPASEELEPVEVVEETTDADAEQEHSEDPDVEVEAEAEAEVEPEVEPEPSEARSEQREAKPFSFKTYGKTVAVEGATLHEVDSPDGQKVEMVVMPKASFDRHILPHTVDRAEIQRREAAYQKQLAELNPDRNEAVIRAKTLIDAVSKALESQEAFEEFAVNFDRNKQLLMLQVENATKDARLAAREQEDRRHWEQAATVHVWETITQDLPASVEDVAKALGVQAPTHVLDEIRQFVALDPARYYLRATEDHARQYGVQVGQVVRNDALLAATIERFVHVASLSSQQQKQVEGVKKKNQAALAPKKAPPTVPAKGSPTPTKQGNEPKSREEWAEMMGLN
jgi:hypothetical protein